MNRRNCFPTRYTLAVVAALLLVQSSAQAGPPLLCHPFEIGNAKSLPWQGPDWTAIQPDYDLSRLVEDTLALLKHDTPALVRMETLRRATIYARKDPRLSNALLARLKARAVEGETKGQRDAMALFDAGYLIESYRQASWISSHTQDNYWKFSQADPGKDLDGYAWVLKAIQYRGGDPEMEFAAALITTDGGRRKEHEAHLRRAEAGAREGSLLARNLERHRRLQGKSAKAS